MQQAIASSSETDYIIRKCISCNRVNRIVLDMAIHARCGACGRELSLSYYDILGVPVEASEDELRRSYHQRVLTWHPDRRPGDQTSSQQFQMILRAYRTLADPEARQLYNQLQVPLLHIHTRSESATEANQEGQKKESGSSTSHSTPAVPNTRINLLSPNMKMTLRVSGPALLMILTLLIWVHGVQHFSTAVSAVFLMITMAWGILGVVLVVVSLSSLGTSRRT